MARILLADASATSRLFVVKLLEEDGHTVEETSSGRDAVEACLSSPPDCLIMEMVLQDLDGFKVLAALQEKKVAFPIVVMTDLRMKSVEDQCKAFGVRAYLKKPVPPAQLREVMTQIFGEAMTEEARRRTQAAPRAKLR